MTMMMEIGSKEQHDRNKIDSEDEIARLRNELETQRNLCEKYETRIKILEQRRDDTTLDTTQSKCSELVLSLKTLLDRNDRIRSWIVFASFK